VGAGCFQPPQPLALDPGHSLFQRARVAGVDFAQQGLNAGERIGLPREQPCGRFRQTFGRGRIAGGRRHVVRHLLFSALSIVGAKSCGAGPSSVKNEVRTPAAPTAQSHTGDFSEVTRFTLRSGER
jgi:hypothetical protein